jgi:hypothetical protein
MRGFVTPLAVVVVILGAAAGQLPASVILPDLPVGFQYQLAFATSGLFGANSSDIADYNTFVTQQAALSPFLPFASWHAIASTQNTNARDNAPTYASIPIYNTIGQLVATGSSGLWGGELLQNPIDYDQYGNSMSGAEWQACIYTGTNIDGTADPDYYCGSTAGYITIGAPTGAHLYGYGYASPEPGVWIDVDNLPSNGYQPFYALSTVITVAPEPSAIVFVGVGAISLLTFAKRRRQAV